MIENLKNIFTNNAELAAKFSNPYFSDKENRRVDSILTLQYSLMELRAI